MTESSRDDIETVAKRMLEMNNESDRNLMLKREVKRLNAKLEHTEREAWNACLDECTRVIDSKVLSGDYKDCPAAWVNSSWKIFKEILGKLRK